MSYISFIENNGFIYHWCGKFLAPNADWTHLTRDLTDYELMVVTDGILYIAADDKEYKVKAGEYLLMPPTHFQHGYKSSDCSFYWMHFGYNNEKNDHSVFCNNCNSTALSDDIKEAECGIHLTFPLQDVLPSPDRIIVLMKQLQDSDRRYKNAELNRHLTNAILCELAMQFVAKDGRDRSFTKELTFRDICDHISWHIGENLSVAELSAYFGYNKKYLTTFFKARSGISLKQYILSEKMERACKILSETGTPVSQIGYSLGFSDGHNFSNAFKKVKGVSPSEYRETYNRQNNFNK